MSIPSVLKRLVVRFLTTDPIVALTSRSSGWATVFMMHRIRFGDLGTPGHDPVGLRETLGWLRRRRYEILDLEDLFKRLSGDGPPPHRAVAFTLDDGYVEQALPAARLFAEFDAPATTFLATGFLDRELWLWWDQLEYVFANTHCSQISIPIGDAVLALDLGSDGAKATSLAILTERCKLLPEAEKLRTICTFSALAEVPIPLDPPPVYRPMTWDEARQAEALGMRFGPQTVTHPILSQTDDRQSRYELVHSWERVVAELRRPLPIFCYPNGLPTDFGPREIRVLEELGLQGSVAGTAGFPSTANFHSPGQRFRLPRVAYSDSLWNNIQNIGGLERTKMALRGAAS